MSTEERSNYLDVLMTDSFRRLSKKSVVRISLHKSEDFDAFDCFMQLTTLLCGCACSCTKPAILFHRCARVREHSRVE